ncbi:MAG TPA: tetratricopeptide repeat protein [Deltaproteobacteria bacterium]|nr:tetratricopeptide repeat protein [Deltaproteobacteria bacterium]
MFLAYLSLASLSLAKPKPAPPRTFSGPNHSEVDLLRPTEGGARIFVQGTLPDGELGLFLVDTGADISVLTRATAERIGLSGLQDGQIWGLSGSARIQYGLLPSLTLGEMTVDGIEVAVGVPGFQDTIGFMPVDGLLGNNVWSRFVLELDYPADLMVLHAPGSVESPRGAAPLFFDNAHVQTPIEVQTAGDEPRLVQIQAQVDTGAGELTVCAATGLPFEGAYTQGLETVRGIGASETLPPFRFLEMTRRIPLQSVRLGGTEVVIDLPARWMSFEDTRTPTCGGTMRALIGHEYLAAHRVWFDYQRGKLALRKSRRPARQINGHRVLYEQELAAHGSPPERGLLRAKLLLGHGHDEDAVGELGRFLTSGEPDPAQRAEARVLLAQLLQHLGKHEEAWAILEEMSPGELVDQDQVVGTVNGLLFANRPAEALRLATDAVGDRPDSGWAHVALADVLLYLGQHDRAQDELLEAAALEHYRDAHLLRRARVALAAGDRYGSMAHVRKLLELYPGGGHYLWFYAMLLDNEADSETFRLDLERAMDRLHPHTRPFDFLVAAHAILGDDQDVDRWLTEGLGQHCEPMPSSPERDNCIAWYFALADRNHDEALRRIESALRASGERPDFLDTKAMVHLARGEFPEARAAARHAARLSPNDVYMLWQAERIEELAAQARRPVEHGAPEGG